MKFIASTFILLLIGSLRLMAQTGYSVTGSVADTTEKINLPNAAVCVLYARDSILVNFSRVNPTGGFKVGNLEKGKFILLVTYPGYADYVEHFTLDSLHRTHHFGRVSLLLKAKLLQEVIVKGSRAAIKIKGDTTEFDPRAFKIQPNATVEDLLKQLPGIQVDKDGKITAEGQTVNKVLVDGEEFFGDDPTLVTKNLRADMVDKVQLYDKKSDQATFTGIDDGQRTKTINLKLKADKKNGYFGKVDGGLATDHYYDGQILFNRFKAKEKFSAYFTTGNDGKTGLGWEESQKYGASDNLQYGDNGEIYITAGSGDGLDSFNGQYNGQGTPLARNGGLHYDSKWNSDKESINANYKIGSLEVSGNSNTLSQNNTPGAIFNSNSGQTFDNYMFRQKLDLTYQLKLDTTSNLKIMVDGTLKNTHALSDYSTSETNGNGLLLNDNNRSIDNRDNSKLFDASAFYTKKFRKKGRTLSYLLSFSQNQTDSHGYLNSRARFYDTVTAKVDSTQLINQYKTASITSSVLRSNLTYTEPLVKDFAVVLNYAFGLNDGTSDRKSFNQSAPGVYNEVVDSLSNTYKLNELSNQFGAIFNFKKNKVTLNFGTRVSGVNFNQTDEITGDVFKRNFINWNPQANFSYRFSQQQGISINYQGNTTQPTIDQIQPIVANTDPLNITIGNPNLTPSFSNRFFFNYNSYKVLSGQSMFIYGNYTFVSNPIVSDLVTNAAGYSTNQYINLPDKKQYNYYMGAYFNRKIDKLDMNIGLNFNFNGNGNYALVNNEINLTQSHSYSAQLTVSKYKEKKYDLYASFGPNYTLSGSSLQPGINNNGHGYDGNWGVNIYLPGRFQIGSDGSYQWRGKTETFNTNFSRTLLNASIARTFLKEDALKISVSGNDLLNQNQGFQRSVSGNFITQNTYSTIRRFFMLSIAYNFNKMGGAPKK